jgi:hypothetical protein
MAVYNTVVTVIACVEAPDADAAVLVLAESVHRAGYETYDYPIYDSPPAFESESGVRAEKLPF